jgi:hypothetical protein
MAEEKVNEVKDEVKKDEVKNEEQKTFTLEEVQNLLAAKNHERDARKNAESEVKSLKEELAKLKGEDSVSKFKEEEYNQLKSQLEELQKEKDELIQKNADNDLKDQLRLFKGVIPEALDDILEKAKKAGFKKTEVGYIDQNGKTLDDFFERLKTSHSYYFGLSSNKNVIPEALQKQIDNAKKTGNTLGMLTEAFKGINLKELK